MHRAVAWRQEEERAALRLCVRVRRRISCWCCAPPRNFRSWKCETSTRGCCALWVKCHQAPFCRVGLSSHEGVELSLTGQFKHCNILVYFNKIFLWCWPSYRRKCYKRCDDSVYSGLETDTIHREKIWFHLYLVLIWIEMRFLVFRMTVPCSNNNNNNKGFVFKRIISQKAFYENKVITLQD